VAAGECLGLIKSKVTLEPRVSLHVIGRRALMLRLSSKLYTAPLTLAHPITASLLLGSDAEVESRPHVAFINFSDMTETLWAYFNHLIFILLVNQCGYCILNSSGSKESSFVLMRKHERLFTHYRRIAYK
jgi:hypothetical protein